MEHVPQPGPAADADRQPGPGVDPRPPSTRRRTRASATRLCAGLPEGVACQYLFYVLANEDGSHAFAVTPEQHEANVQQAIAAGLLD